MAVAFRYSGGMNDDERQQKALWRLSILGSLVNAQLEHGDLCQRLNEIAQKKYHAPDGELVEVTARTAESWYYDYRHGGFEALFPEPRKDRGKSRSISTTVADLLVRAKQERPRRSIPRLIRMFERAKKVRPKELTNSSVHRLLAAHGISSRPLRGPSAERRSFLPEHAGDLWVGDALHGPPVIAPDGRVRKAYLLTQLDAATRYVPYSYFALSEGSAAQEYGFMQAVLKHGPPLTYYVDLGSAYIATSLRLICAEIGTRLLHTDAGDCEAKGAIERWHRTWREEVGDELPDHQLPLVDLNAKHWAWLNAEYHARKHDTTGRAPREHWLAEVGHLRSLPRGKKLEDIFLHRERRKVRKDGTVRWKGGLLEVRPELVGREVELRFPPADATVLPRVFVEGRFFCDTTPLDRHRNNSRRRRRNLGVPEPGVVPTGIDPLAQLEREHYQRTRPVGAPARSPHADDEE